MTNTTARTGWQCDNGIAEWWQEMTQPRIVVQMPPSMKQLRSDIAYMLETAWYCGFTQGLKMGECEAELAMQRAIHMLRKKRGGPIEPQRIEGEA